MGIGEGYPEEVQDFRDLWENEKQQETALEQPYSPDLAERGLCEPRQGELLGT